MLQPTIYHYNTLTTNTDRIPTGPTEPPFDDVAILRYMQGRLYEYISDPDYVMAHPLPKPVYLPEPGGRKHRIVLLNSSVLCRGDELTFVGFFGQKRTAIDTRILDALDIELLEELSNYPQLLSYSSMEIAEGNWGNLVVMSGPDGIEHWATSTRHAYAAREIAPTCYTTIRIHSGTISSGRALEGALHIQLTKHFDFSRHTC